MCTNTISRGRTELGPEAGTYNVVSEEPLRVAIGEGGLLRLSYLVACTEGPLARPRWHLEGLATSLGPVPSLAVRAALS